MRNASAALLLGLLFGCAGSGWDPDVDEAAEKDEGTTAGAAETIARFKRADPSMKRFFDGAHGYAVFPTVGKAGLGVGGAYGEGEVYEQGKLVGTSSLTQLTIGLQLGAQGYSEIVFFADKRALSDFQGGNFELSAQASAVAVTAGASADASYDNGVAIFTMTKGGLMYEASVGGQKFGYTPR